jgi:hypothetical protein
VQIIKIITVLITQRTLTIFLLEKVIDDTKHHEKILWIITVMIIASRQIRRPRQDK